MKIINKFSKKLMNSKKLLKKFYCNNYQRNKNKKNNYF